MAFLSLVAAFYFGYLVCAFFTLGSSDSAWERGFRDGKRASKIAGHVIARNDPIDEIMVEHNGDMARYRRVVD